MMRLETINAIAALNATAIAADKMGAKRVYYCQRCLNHNRLEPRKNHKCECVFANCACNKCILVEKRRVLNTQLHELEEVVDAENDADIDDGFALVARSKGERVPNCQKCGQHGRKSRLKGHKRVCPYRDCDCAKCQVVSERQKLMADQIKIRRRQRKDTLLNITRENITATLNAAAAVAASTPLPYFQNINALIYKQLQENMRNPISMLANNMQPTHEVTNFDSYSNFLTHSDSLGLSLLAGDNLGIGLVACNDKLGISLGAHQPQQTQHQQHQQQQHQQQQHQQQASPTLPHLQFLFQQRQRSASLLNTDRMSVSTTSTSSSSMDEPCSPPIAVPVPINPLINGLSTALTSSTISAIANNTQHIGSTLAPRSIASVTNNAQRINALTNSAQNPTSLANSAHPVTTLTSCAQQASSHASSGQHLSPLTAGMENVTPLTNHNDNNNNHQQQQQQQQQIASLVANTQRLSADTEIPPLSTSSLLNSLTAGNLSAFLDSEQIFHTLLNNMRLLEHKMLFAESIKNESEVPTSAFVDVCTM